MKNVIAILTNNLRTMEYNEPINRSEGKIEQADLEVVTAAEIRQALAILEASANGPIWAAKP